MKNAHIAIGILIAVLGLLLLAGCANINSGNVAANVGPLPYKDGEQSVVTTEKSHTEVRGNKTDTEKVTKSGLAVNEGIQHHKLEVAEKVGVAQAKAQVFWESFWTAPTTPGYYGGTGNYYTGGWGSFTTGSSEGGRNIIATSQ